MVDSFSAANLSLVSPGCGRASIANRAANRLDDEQQSN